MRKIETRRLSLEPQTIEHSAEMFALLADPSIYEFENEPPPSQDWLTKRFQMLESRRSPDGTEQWLNWILRLRASGRLLGYVQATVRPNSQALIAYQINSAFWGQGFGQEAVGAMIHELGKTYHVAIAIAVFKKSNFRSRKLLRRLGFRPASEESAAYGVELDEHLMIKSVCGS
ncbi:MAG TPA: GNAT family N-acetyltransferase [Casimicrobiaceae bacterium]|nr:GNAT family N-acetyltransferase [Casimicrobiaceae bacterium]